MAIKDYSEEEDFYSQGFERQGVLSVWLSLEDRRGEERIDTLQDLCGVGYYRLSDQESNSLDHELVDVERLLLPLSYSSSFSKDVISTARMKGVGAARRIVVQYDFAYDPKKITRAIAEDPVFIGVFNYSEV
ncbi:hypothetical protein D3C85_1504850 [compost metagenome]